MKENAPKLGQIINGEAFRDAVHIAVTPVTVSHRCYPGDRVGLLPDGNASPAAEPHIGVLDPYLEERAIQKGETVWLLMLPNTITGLRHEWTHPAFAQQQQTSKPPSREEESKEWMTRWAVAHMGSAYYGDENKLSPEIAYSNAIQAGHSMSVGSHEDARDHIDSEWWTHWENITGCKGRRDEYFTCAC